MCINYKKSLPLSISLSLERALSLSRPLSVHCCTVYPVEAFRFLLFLHGGPSSPHSTSYTPHPKPHGDREALSRPLSLSLARSLSLVLALSRSLSLSLALARSLLRSLSLSLSRPLAVTDEKRTKRPRARLWGAIERLSLSLFSLSLTHTHTHTHTHSHPHTHTPPREKRTKRPRARRAPTFSAAASSRLRVEGLGLSV